MLEVEIVKLREAVEALTRALGAVEKPTSEEKPVDAAPEPAVEVDVEPADEPKAVTHDEAHQATLAFVRRDVTNKDKVRAALAMYGAKKITDLSAADLATYHAWVVAQ